MYGYLPAGLARTIPLKHPNMPANLGAASAFAFAAARSLAFNLAFARVVLTFDEMRPPAPTFLQSACALAFDLALARALLTFDEMRPPAPTFLQSARAPWKDRARGETDFGVKNSTSSRGSSVGLQKAGDLGEPVPPAVSSSAAALEEATAPAGSMGRGGLAPAAAGWAAAAPCFTEAALSERISAALEAAAAAARSCELAMAVRWLFWIASRYLLALAELAFGTATTVRPVAGRVCELAFFTAVASFFTPSLPFFTPVPARGIPIGAAALSAELDG